MPASAAADDHHHHHHLTAPDWREVLARKDSDDDNDEHTTQLGWSILLEACLHVSSSSRTGSRVEGGVQSVRPLPVLLFLFDSLTILRTLSDFQAASSSISGAVRLGLEHTLELNELVEHFFLYLQELYLPSSYQEETTSPQPPFCLDADTIPSLPSLVQACSNTNHSSDIVIQEAISTLRQTCAEALDWLRDWREPSSGQDLFTRSTTYRRARTSNAEISSASPGESSQTEDTKSTLASAKSALPSPSDIIAHALEYSDLPQPDISLQSTISQALSDKRQTMTMHTPNERRRSVYSSNSYGVGVCRWILASLLKHYHGGDEFGQHASTEHDGRVRYAKREEDDQAIRNYFSKPKRHSTSDTIISYLSTTTMGSPVSPTERVDPRIKAELMASRRDDKLRWLFGEPVSSRTINPGPPPSAASFLAPILSPIPPMSPIYSPPMLRYYPHKREMLVAQHGDRSPSTAKAPPPLQLSSTQSFGGMPSGSPSLSPHRRAFSADSSLALRSPSYSVDNTPRRTAFKASEPLRSSTNPSTPRDTSFDDISSLDSHATGSPRHWGGTSLFTIGSIESADSQTRLLSSSAGGSRGRQRSHTAVMPTLRDSSPGSSPRTLKQPITTTRGHPAAIDRRPSLDSIRSEPSLRSTALPPTVNLLSMEEKQNLVRKNRKLRAVLGPRVGQQDDKAFIKALHQRTRTEVAVDILPSRNLPPGELLRAEIPIDAPFSTYLVGAGMDGADSHGMSRAHSSPLPAHSAGGSAVSLAATGLLIETEATTTIEGGCKTPTVPDSPFSDQSQDERMQQEERMTRAHADAITAAREARRRKLMKVQSFLGERVPATALLEHAAGPRSPLKTPNTPATPSPAKGGPARLLSRASSKLLTKARPASMFIGGNRWGSSSSLPTSSSRHHTLSNASSASSSTVDFSNTDSLAIIEGQRQQRRLLSRKGSKTSRREGQRPDDASSLADSQLADDAACEQVEPAVMAIRRARKLEKVFGAQAPQQALGMDSRKPKARDDRHVYPAKKFSGPKQGYPRSSPFGSKLSHTPSVSTMHSVKSKSSTSSLSQYRRSIASLRYIAESGDAQLLNDFAKVVLAEESEAEEDGQGMPKVSTSRHRLGSHATSSTSSSRTDNAATEDDDAAKNCEDAEEGEIQSASVLRRRSVRKSGSFSKSLDLVRATSGGPDILETIATPSNITSKSMKDKQPAERHSQDNRIHPGEETDEELAGLTSEDGGSHEVLHIRNDSTLSFLPQQKHYQNAHYHGQQMQLRGGRDSMMSAQTAYSRADSAYEHEGTEDQYGSDPEPFSFSALGAGGTGRSTSSDQLTSSLNSSTATATSAPVLASHPLVRSVSRSSSSRSSMESVRLHVRRAHKLAKVFGTTKGEVFEKVLRGIEDDIAELDEDDEDFDPDERNEILQNVAALRAAL